MKLFPWSRNMSMMRLPSASLVGASSLVPKFIAPRQSRLTFNPDFPRFTYSITISLIFCGTESTLPLREGREIAQRFLGVGLRKDRFPSWRLTCGGDVAWQLQLRPPTPKNSSLRPNFSTLPHGEGGLALDMLQPLKLHPDYRCAAVSQISVDVTRNTKVLMLRYIVKGETGSIRIPARVEPARTNGLWRNTCFEVFVKMVSAPRHGSSSDGGYWEFNFSPSTQWAAYSFTGRREGMAPFDIVAPGI